MEYSSKSLSDIVEQYIKDQILFGRCQSGDKVTEVDISQKLGISRAPVREALRSLNVQGLLYFSPRRGHYVWEMSHNEILETFQIRIALELQVLHILVVGNVLTQADFAHLEELSRQMEEDGERAGDVFERTYALNSRDIAFHRHLWQASGSKRHAALLENLFYQLLIVMNENIASLGTPREKAREHRQMAEALKTKNAQRVCGELQNHLHKYMLAALGTLTEQETQTLQALFRMG